MESHPELSPMDSSNSKPAPAHVPNDSKSETNMEAKRKRKLSKVLRDEEEDIDSVYETRRSIDPNIAKQSEECFDRFLSIRPINPNESLTTISTLKLSKQLKQINVKPINVTNVGKQLTIQVSQCKETINLLQCTSLCDIDVIVEPHSKLNISKGVIKCPHLNYCTVEEVVEEIPNVIEAYRMSIKRNDQTLLTNTWVLTFNTPRCPNMIDTCSWVKNVKVTPYIPKPMRCHKCQRIGHTQKKCKGTPRCKICGEAPHGTRET